MLKLYALFLIIGLCVFACSHDITAPTNETIDNHAKADALASSIDEEFISSNLKFAIKVFHKIEEQDSHENIFISPLSLSIALAMAYNGSLGETQKAMANTLEFRNILLNMVNDEYSKLIRSLQNYDASVQVSISNSIWINDNFPVKKDFVGRNEDYFFAKVANLDFSLTNAADIINSWIEQNTNGKISDVITIIDPSDIMFIINALYFKGDWKFQFDEANTEEDNFYLSNGTTKKVPMMSNGGLDYTYYFANSFSAVRMPYGRDIISMYIFLPNYGYELGDLFTNLKIDNWNNWMTSFDSLPEPDPRFVFKLPKFKLEYEKNFNEMLKALGMGIAFTSSANFGGISDNSIWIGYVKQKAFIEVNEKGSEAAAVTVISVVRSEPPGFIVNRPFFFTIRDDRSGTILFMGKILEPIYN